MIDRIVLGSELEGDCLIWKGATFRNGYGAICVGGKAKRVHRLMFQLIHPEIDIAGKVIRHKCDIPLCCNPAHLIEGTQQDNMEDKVIRGRAARVLSEHNVKFIRANQNSISCAELARMFNVTSGNIRKILLNKIWKHV